MAISSPKDSMSATRLPDSGATNLLPGKYRLFQLGHAGSAARQHFTELVDQSRRRRVNEATGVTKPDHAPRAFRNGDKVERVYLFDLVKRNAMHRCDLSGVRRPGRTFGRPHHDRRNEIAGTGWIIVE